MDFVRQVFWDVDSTLILNIPLNLREVEDSIYWHYDKFGRYTIRSGYKAMMDSLLDIGRSINCLLLVLVER
ncbi:hypothetical protein TorRG33x02_226200, partial [Trema orientale]